MHGSSDGAPTRKQNGNYRHGKRTKEVIQAVRYINLLPRLARSSPMTIYGGLLGLLMHTTYAGRPLALPRSGAHKRDECCAAQVFARVYLLGWGCCSRPLPER